MVGEAGGWRIRTAVLGLVTALAGSLVALAPAAPVHAAVTPAVIAEIEVGGDPLWVAADPERQRAYVTNRLLAAVTVIDTATNTVVEDIGPLRSPFGVDLDPALDRLYVAERTGGSVTVIDTATNAVVDTIVLGQQTLPYSVAVDRTTHRVYVTDQFGSSVWVIDGTTGTVVGTISLEFVPFAVAVDSTSQRVYVTAALDGTLATIDGTTGMVVDSTSIGTQAGGVAVDPITQDVWVVDTGTDAMTILDGETGFAGDPIAVGRDPIGVAVDPTTRVGYVAARDGTLSIVSGFTGEVTSTVPIVPLDALAVGVDPVTHRAYVTTSVEGIVSVVQGPTDDLLVAPASGTTDTLTPFTGQLVASNAVGEVSFLQEDGTEAVQVTAAGAVSSTAPLAAGTYDASGWVLDAQGNVGAWAFRLTVTARSLATTPTGTTVEEGEAASDQLVSTGGAGQTTYTQLSGAPGIAVSQTGAVNVAATLAPGVHEATGRVEDPYGNAGEWTYRVTVTAAPESTTLDVAPVLLRLWPLQVHLGQLSARLTAEGTPVVGQVVAFSAGGRRVCTDITDENGVATCRPGLGGLLLVLVTGGVDASFAGADGFLPTSGRGGLVG